MRLFWTRRAAHDRKVTREYIAAENPAAAVALDELFARKAASLLAHPELGRVGRLAGTRELVVHQNYVLVYDVVGEAVRVLRLLHAARQWPPNLQAATRPD